MEQLKKTILIYDLFVAFAFIGSQFVKFITVMSMSKAADLSQTTVRETFTLFEANPIYKYIMTLNQLSVVGINLILPAIGLATYWYYRNKVKCGKMEVINLGYFVMFIFYMIIFNILNDSATYLGLIIRGWYYMVVDLLQVADVEPIVQELEIVKGKFAELIQEVKLRLNEIDERLKKVESIKK